ncbi:hypothetical protein [Methylocystis parvus]|uniref:Uncharacterized protein n=1 Tax=Methylocystis parvus TaxID=134 RepID=A0A6B8M5M7_9HYPH|nr:hypothetical protein [Methylocystis parvus]QGM97748.1 hypothetical protein F7D14_09890 [Methylocystis parvus]WBK01948.1 hypothetical protein MMG94_09695 [Methylocystis parvus OBBP]
MQISLQEAIEIHAKALKKRHRDRAPAAARQHAMTLKYANDPEGHDVWQRVAEAAERLLSEAPEIDDPRR